MNINDPQYGHGFGEREYNINDVISRLDMDIYMEAAASCYDPEIEDPFIKEAFARDDAEKIAWDIFEERIKELCPYHVQLSGTLRSAKFWCRDHTYGRLRLVTNGILFESKEDAALCKLKWKRFRLSDVYVPQTFVVEAPENYKGIIEWLNENVGERYFAWFLPRQADLHFYNEDDAIHYKMVWG